MNRDTFEGKFKEISGELKKKWGELTDDEIRKSEGDAEVLAGIIQQKFGIERDEATRNVSELMKRLEKKFSPQEISGTVSSKVESIKQKIKRT